MPSNRMTTTSDRSTKPSTTIHNKPYSVAFLPSVGSLFIRIRRMLTQRSNNRAIKYLGLLHIKLSSLLHPVTDHLELRIPDNYRMPCECRRVYNEPLLQYFVKEHQQHIWLEHSDKPAIADILSTTDTAFNSTIFPFWPRKTDIWTAFLGRPLRLNSTLTVTTEVVATVSVDHGRLLSAPQKTFGTLLPKVFIKITYIKRSSQ
jgi:hypothetical protein